MRILQINQNSQWIILQWIDVARKISTLSNKYMYMYILNIYFIINNIIKYKYNMYNMKQRNKDSNENREREQRKGNKSWKTRQFIDFTVGGIQIPQR